ncbi:MAG: class II fructose-bisphosphate aldolase [Paracoccaceae bacterium]
MTLVTLENALQNALKNNYAVAGLVTLGWEDMKAYVEAAEKENCPVILQAGPSCRQHTPLPILGKMFNYLADNSDIPVVAHLDHGYSLEECKIAIDSGFSSVMYDGSRKSLNENIDETAKICEIAHSAGVSCEGEIGFVGYSGGEESAGTDPDEASLFAKDTKVDAMAISVGNVHLQENKEGGLDEDRIRSIEALTDVPLVIHGGSGVPVKQRKYLSKNSKICKFNIGTELRSAFGSALRNAVNDDHSRFDRVQILKDTHKPLVDKTRSVLKAFKPA